MLARSSAYVARARSQVKQASPHVPLDEHLAPIIAGVRHRIVGDGFLDGRRGSGRLLTVRRHRRVGEESLAKGGHLVSAPHDDPVDPLEGRLLLYGLSTVSSEQ